jgi:hypothetical protein
MTSTTGMTVLVGLATAFLAPIVWMGRRWNASRDSQGDMALALQHQRWENMLPLALLAYVEVLALLLAAAFGMDGAMWNAGMSVVLFGVTGAAGATGALVGFLFGIPRFLAAERASALSAAPAPADTTPALVPRDMAPVDVLGTYRPSTNLDDIADWLTKIIVGVGLTQLTSIGPALRSVSAAIRTNCGTTCPSDSSISSLVIISSITCFLLAYLWTRLHYNKLVARSDREVVRLLLEKEEKAAVARFGLGKVARTDGAAMARLVVADDPNKGQFGGSARAGGRVLRAMVEPTAAFQNLYRITLTVTSTEPERPLADSVEFHLHPTFRKQVVRQEVLNGSATLVLIAYGAFTVGAVADGGETKLELDLAELETAPAEFRAR